MADVQGIETRHARGCGSRNGTACDCEPSFRATVFDRRTGRRIRRTFPTEAAARRWREDARVDLRRGRLTGGSPITVLAAGEALIDGMRAGSVLNRSGDPYKPKTIRGYEQALRDHVLPSLGGVRLSALHHNQVQDLVERMAACGAEPSTLRNAIMPLRVICRLGRSARLPFSPSTLDTRAARAWNAADLQPITLHECRHTFASLMIAAGVNAKALQTFMGHASITITLDRYGHLFPGAEGEAAALFDAYLGRAVGQSRGTFRPDPAAASGFQPTLPEPD